MSRKTIRNLVFVLSLMLVGVACSDSSTGSDDNNQETAQVEGRVDNTSSGSQKAKPKVNGAVVTAAKVNAQGELETLGDTEATTNAQGEFTLEVKVSAIGNAGNKIIVFVEKNGETAKAYVGSEVKGGTTVKVQPITFESSAEASVYQQAVANNEEDAVSKADIEVMVNADVATDIESNASSASEVESALKAQSDAKASFYTTQSVDLSSDQKNQIVKTKQEAFVQLEASLDAASDTEAEEDAFETFLEVVAKAETDAGVQAAAVAKSSEASAKMLFSESVDLSSDAQAELRQNASVMLTFALDQAVQAQLQAAGASQTTIDAASDAAVKLRADIKAMSNASVSNIESAFAEFNSDIEAAVSGDSILKGDLFAAANSSVNAEGGPKATLETALKGSINTNVVMNAYSSFYSSVHSTVSSTFTSASDAQVEAYAELLILINLTS